MLGSVQAALLGGSVRGAAYTYLLKTAFAGAADQTFTEGQVLDTAAEGVTTGSLTVHDNVAALSIQIVSGELKFVAGSGHTTEGEGLANGLVTRAAGTVLKWGMRTEDVTDYVPGFPGWMSGNTLAYSQRRHTLIFETGGFILVGHMQTGGYANIQMTANGTYANNTTYEFAIVLLAAGAAYFSKIGGDWKLLFVETANTANLYPCLQYYNDGAGDDGWLTRFDVAQGFTVAPLCTLTDGTANTAAADVIIVGTFTFVAAATWSIEWRRDGDGQNCWRLKFAAGTLSLHTVTGGVESAALASSSLSLTAGVSYHWQVIHRGTDWVKILLSGALSLSYTSSNTHQSAATGVKFTSGTITTVSLACYKGSGWTEMDNV